MSQTGQEHAPKFSSRGTITCESRISNTTRGACETSGLLDHASDRASAATTLRCAAERGVDLTHAWVRWFTGNNGSHLSVTQDIARADDHDASPRRLCGEGSRHTARCLRRRSRPRPSQQRRRATSPHNWDAAQARGWRGRRTSLVPVFECVVSIRKSADQTEDSVGPN
jgi:hypothetical protein